MDKKTEIKPGHEDFEHWGVDISIPEACTSNTEQKNVEAAGSRIIADDQRWLGNDTLSKPLATGTTKSLKEDLDRRGVDIRNPSACTSNTEQKNVEAADSRSACHICNEECCFDAFLKALLEEMEEKLFSSEKYDDDHLKRKRDIFRRQNHASSNVGDLISHQCQEKGCVPVKDSRNCLLNQISLNPNKNQSLTIARESKGDRNIRIIDVESLDGYRGRDPIDVLVKYIETPSNSKYVEGKGNSKKKNLIKKENGVNKVVLGTKENDNKKKYVKKQQSNSKDIKKKVNIEKDVKEKEIDFDKNIKCKDKLLNSKTEKEMDAIAPDCTIVPDKKKKGKKQRATIDKPKSN